MSFSYPHSKRFLHPVSLDPSSSQEYDLEYGYNLAGQLVSEKYPSGRVVTNSYDANGRLASIADASRTYLSGLQYQGNGNSLSSITLGNATTQSFALNDRMQMTTQELKRGTEVLQKYVYGYGQIDGSGALDTAKNNGQLGQVESWIGTAKQWTQKFSYDPVGRLKESAEYRGDNLSLTYKQVFDFDRFGNMYRKAASNPAAGQANPLPYTAIEDADISKATNRFATETTYDDAGNVITDNKFRDMGFSYDANGRMVKATKASTPDALSVYDASGLRVAEYGGPPSTDDGGVKYVLSDWQGSTRTIINNAGFATARTDYTAYGENITSGVGLRTPTQGFGASNDLHQKYALTESDDATGLDHTPWRKHENNAGRWTSPDPYSGSASIADPQSFNRYSYVGSDPTNSIDPSGLKIIAVPQYECIYVLRFDRWEKVCGIAGFQLVDTGLSLGGSGIHSDSNDNVGNTVEAAIYDSTDAKKAARCVSEAISNFTGRVGAALKAYGKTMGKYFSPAIVSGAVIALLGVLGTNPWAVLGGLSAVSVGMAAAGIDITTGTRAAFTLAGKLGYASGRYLRDTKHCEKEFGPLDPNPYVLRS